MSGLLNAVLQAGGGQAVEMLGGRFGLGPQQTRAAIDALLPMVAGGMKRQAQAPGGLECLLGSVIGPGHAAYVEDPQVVARPGTTAAGERVLGAIFDDDRDVSRAVAGQAAQQTGIDASILKKMLPVVAMLAAGAMARGADQNGLGGLLGAAMGSGGGLGGGGLGGGGLGGALGGLLGAGQPAQQATMQPGAPAAGGLGGLASMLDLDRDGNPLDDILGMLGRR